MIRAHSEPRITGGGRLSWGGAPGAVRSLGCIFVRGWGAELWKVSEPQGTQAGWH